MKNCEKIYKYHHSCVSRKYDLTESRYITVSHRVSCGSQKHCMLIISTFCKSYFLRYGGEMVGVWVNWGGKVLKFAETHHHNF